MTFSDNPNAKFDCYVILIEHSQKEILKKFQKMENPRTVE